MAFYKIKSGRVTGERGVLTFVGEIGHLFYSQDDNTIRISDGHTPGGIPLSGGSITFLTQSAPQNPQPGQLWFDPTTGRLYVWFDDIWVDANPQITSNSYTPAVPSNWNSTVTTIAQALDEIAARLRAGSL